MTKRKQWGTPFVLGVLAGRTFRVISASAQLPPYSELKREVPELLANALRDHKPT